MPDLEFQDLKGPFLSGGNPRLRSIGGARAPSPGRWTHRASRPPAHGSRSKGELLEFREDRVCRLRIVYDMMDVSRQVGIVPKPGEPVERPGRLPSGKRVTQDQPTRTPR